MCLLTPLLAVLCRYGFRTPPHLELKARPKLGEREVTLAHVTEWIEKKLEQEFQVRLLGVVLEKNVILTSPGADPPKLILSLFVRSTSKAADESQFISYFNSQKSSIHVS